MSFGYSVGDVIAIAGLVERIVLEVKSYRAAPLHFRRLAIELDFLGQVCSQIFDLRPSLPDELAHIERIRAIAVQCLGPLRAFEEKMKGYENSLGLHIGSHSPRLGGFGKRKRFMNKVADFKHQLHWSVIARQEVDELRAILTSEILAINTLLTMHGWQTSKNQRISNQAYTSQLKKLISTTEAASTEIQKFLVDAKAASERLEELIKSGNLTQAEQVRILTTMENKSTETQKLVKDLSQWHQNYAAGVREAVNNAQAQVVKLFSLKQYMEEWIIKIVEYCKEITAKVQRNTDILLSLHAMLAKFEFLLGRARIDLPAVVFENVFGIKMLLPLQLCDTWDSFSRLLRVMFFNKPGLQLVTAGRFLIMYSESNRIISPQTWSTSIVAGDQLSMSMILEGLSPRACPRCQIFLSSHPAIGRNGITCPNCRLWLSLTDVEHLEGGVSTNATEHPIPAPPPETIRLQSSSWNGQWNSSYIREQALSRQAKLRRQRIRYNAAAGMGPVTEEITTFRRVHVLPYQGDILKALIEPGKKLRELMIDISAKSPSQSSVDSLPFEQTFSSILADFNELKDTHVSPLLELHKRSMSNPSSSNAALQAWIEKTRLILMKAPFKSEEHQAQIQEICLWLERIPILTKATTAPTTTTTITTTLPLQEYTKGTKFEKCQELFDHYHQLLNNSHRGYAPMQSQNALYPVHDTGFFVLGGLMREHYNGDTDTPAMKVPQAHPPESLYDIAMFDPP